jgi:hypothetical protein
MATVLFLIVALVCYFALQMLDVRYDPCARCDRGRGRGRGRDDGRDHFINSLSYRPTCAGRWAWQGTDACRGLTTSYLMPSIEDAHAISWAPCCGSMNVPPPVTPPYYV